MRIFICIGCLLLVQLGINSKLIVSLALASLIKRLVYSLFPHNFHVISVFKIYVSIYNKPGTCLHELFNIMFAGACLHELFNIIFVLHFSSMCEWYEPMAWRQMQERWV